MDSFKKRWAAALVCALGVGLAVRCPAPRAAVDILASRLAEASVNGQDAQSVGPEVGRPRRISDVVHASLPATPPSRLKFIADVPIAGRLILAAGIPGRHHFSTAVEFVVSVRHRGRETAVLSRLVDPANRGEDRSWVPMEVDLSSYARRGAEIILETRGFEETRDVDRAFWGTPTITTVTDRSAPLVVVYLVDTLRADHLPLYGYGRATAPELGRFARDALVFDQAIAPSSWTKPSVASIFTSLLPSEHRCVQFYTPLDPSFVTIAERLQEHGYLTGAVVANRLVHAKDAHFDQGFSYFASPPEPQSAKEVVDTALSFLTARQGLPTFLYVHTMDPHSPYAPPPPFDRRFGEAPKSSRAAAEPYDYKEPADLARIVAQYDGEIAYGDQEFGRFLRELKARGLYDRALIVFLSDHGEEFLDHGGWVHGHTLFDELVRVPLVVKYPGKEHAIGRIDRQVSLVDILPTILKSQGLPVPEPPAIAGRTLEESLTVPPAAGVRIGLRPDVRPDAQSDEQPVVFETKYREYVAYGARTRVDKYVRHLNPKGQESYFDLLRDPLERVNRLQESGARGQALKRIAEMALTPAAYRYQLRVEGNDDYELQIQTSGWIESVETTRLGPTERARTERGGRRLALSLKPRFGRPREVGVLMRPHGVPLQLAGTRGGRPLRPSDIRIAADGVAAKAVPFEFPDIEDVHGIFSAPRARRPGIAMWVVSSGRGEVPQLDLEALERLKALGYLQFADPGTGGRGSRKGKD